MVKRIPLRRGIKGGCTHWEEYKQMGRILKKSDLEDRLINRNLC